MLMALKNMKNGKSPGLDGFTTVFYIFFWSDLNYFTVRTFRTTPRSQTRYTLFNNDLLDLIEDQELGANIGHIKIPAPT